jgi:hypothetical protein
LEGRVHTGVTIAIIIGVVVLCWSILSIPPFIKLIKLRSVNKATNINALPDKGYVEIAGAIGQRVIQSPVEKTDCVYWSLDVEEMIQKSRGSMAKGYSSKIGWRTLLKQASAEPIEIDDATGKILLQPKHIELLIDHPNQSIDLDEQKLIRLNQLGIKTINPNGTNREIAVYEQTVAPGLQVHVIGEIRKDGFQRSIIKPIIFSGEVDLQINKLKKQLRGSFSLVLLIAVVGLMLWLLASVFPGHLGR